jgi:DNA segregation ATPase FtsK/SpoIIIE, S-DNA-T family
MIAVLRWALAEMDNRYRLLETARARDLAAYNKRQERKNLPILPRIVIFIDELADLMMSAPDQTEHSLVRLAQLARATGIHLVVATQAPKHGCFDWVDQGQLSGAHLLYRGLFG